MNESNLFKNMRDFKNKIQCSKTVYINNSSIGAIEQPFQVTILNKYTRFGWQILIRFLKFNLLISSNGLNISLSILSKNFYHLFLSNVIIWTQVPLPPKFPVRKDSCYCELSIFVSFQEGILEKHIQYKVSKTLLRFTVQWGNQQKGWLQLEHMLITLASVAISAKRYLRVAIIKNASASSSHLLALRFKRPRQQLRRVWCQG